jgi:hypothetical protein
MRNNNREVCKVIGHDAQSARRDLSERCVAEPELLDQESVAEQVGGVLRAGERRDWVSLGIAVVRLRIGRFSSGWGTRTVFPMTRTGFLSSLWQNEGSRSTERTGHPYAA